MPRFDRAFYTRNLLRQEYFQRQPPVWLLVVGLGAGYFGNYCRQGFVKTLTSL